MTDQTSSRKEVVTAQGAKIVIAKTGTTVTGATDTITLDLSDYGISTLLAVHGFVHTTDGSVIVVDAGTTSVSGDTLTYLTAAGNTNKRRVIVVYGE